MNRPPMLNSDRMPTNPLAAATVTDDTPLVRKKSWIIGPACSMMPMPAVTLQNSTVHNSQNCGVRIAFAADTFAVVIIGAFLTVLRSKPSGSQPLAGTRTLVAPKIISRK